MRGRLSQWPAWAQSWGEGQTWWRGPQGGGWVQASGEGPQESWPVSGLWRQYRPRASVSQGHSSLPPEGVWLGDTHTVLSHGSLPFCPLDP